MMGIQLETRVDTRPEIANKMRWSAQIQQKCIRTGFELFPHLIS